MKASFTLVQRNDELPYLPAGLTLGIDATNLRQGGGRTHLIELLRAVNPQDHGLGKVVVWGAKSTLALLDEHEWLIKRNPSAQESGLIRRTLWQRFDLSRQARAEGCDILFVPGGNFTADFHPVVTMSRNMLPFEWRELVRYGVTFIALRLLLLRWAQSRSFKRADGVIFLTRYAQEAVQRVTGDLPNLTKIISHGIDRRFIHRPKLQKAITHYSSTQPYRMVYASPIAQYKHQWHVVEAVGLLRRKTGWPLTLDLVGPAESPALARLKTALHNWNDHEAWVRLRGAVPYTEMHQIYQQSDLGIFASSCENMPNILLETMASGLPVASSKRGPMPEILVNTGVYFDPEDPVDIARGLEQLITDPAWRASLAEESFSVSLQYNWERCAEETFDFIASAYRRHHRLTTQSVKSG